MVVKLKKKWRTKELRGNFLSIAVCVRFSGILSIFNKQILDFCENSGAKSEWHRILIEFSATEAFLVFFQLNYWNLKQDIEKKIHRI